VIVILNHIKQWEQTGYIGVQNKEVFRAIVVALRNHGGPTHFTHLTNGNDEIGYTEAKSLATEGTEKELYDEPYLDIDPKFNPTGAQLASMTQAIAYKEICKTKSPRDRR
jgi:hypothetical protein